MQFLLLLTALISALTGAFAGSRPADARLDQAEAQMVAAVQAVIPASAAAERPVQRLPSLVQVAEVLRQALPVPALSMPLAGIRLIE